MIAPNAASFDRMRARLEAAGLILRVGDRRVLTPAGNACAHGLARGAADARATIATLREKDTCL